jgi:hypothetical protein
MECLGVSGTQNIFPLVSVSSLCLLEEVLDNNSIPNLLT